MDFLERKEQLLSTLKRVREDIATLEENADEFERNLEELGDNPTEEELLRFDRDNYIFMMLYE